MAKHISKTGYYTRSPKISEIWLCSQQECNAEFAIEVGPLNTDGLTVVFLIFKNKGKYECKVSGILGYSEPLLTQEEFEEAYGSFKLALKALGIGIKPSDIKAFRSKVGAREIGNNVAYKS